MEQQPSTALSSLPASSLSSSASVLDDWALVAAQSGSASSRVSASSEALWFRFQWVHTYKVFREHYFDVDADNTVCLWSVESDSGNHGEFTQIDENTFRIKVHWRGDASPWKHELCFLSLEAERRRVFRLRTRTPLMHLVRNRALKSRSDPPLASASNEFGAPSGSSRLRRSCALGYD